MVITRSRFAGMKFQPVQPGQISPYDYMGKSIFITEMYLYGFFQTDVLIHFFILLRRAEAITRDPGGT